MLCRLTSHRSATADPAAVSLGLGGIQAARDAAEAQGAAGSNSGDEATAQAMVPDPAFLLMASTSMAMSLVFSIWIFFRATGAAFNVRHGHLSIDGRV